MRILGAMLVSRACAAPPRILVVGSANVDTTIEVTRLPRPGETVACTQQPVECAGGKGLNQAVAAARLGASVVFACRLGDDGAMLLRALEAEGVDTSHVSQSGSCGRGYVVLEKATGLVLSIVSAGANGVWESFEPPVDGHDAVLLQREIPAAVNAAAAAAAKKKGCVVFLDAGGGAALDDEALACVDWFSPNLTELAEVAGVAADALASDEAVVDAAQALRRRFGGNVLVTLGERGAIAVTDKGVVAQAAMPASVVDETAAGDGFRAAFALELASGASVEKALEFAACAGSLAVSRRGAASSLPTRDECLSKLRGGCPWRFASRLNSMKDRRDLAGDSPNDTLGWIRRQGSIKGLDLVDLNYPQHTEGYTVDDIRAALKHAGLECGAVCLRYPPQYRRGSFTHPDAATRRSAVRLTIEACDWARSLGASEVCVWSAYDGYDYSLQVDYAALWDRAVDGFRQVCDAAPDIKISLEFKPTDENTRFFAVPSTGAALLLAQQVDRPNFGLTLDVGHCLAAGENPAQSLALVAAQNKLFGVQLNDGYQRIGAEDGLIFASVHPLMALDFVLWLHKSQFQGHVYFDTFPRNEDPVKECEFNIKKVKALYDQAERLTAAGIDHLAWAKHDALAAIHLVDSLTSGSPAQ